MKISIPILCMAAALTLPNSTVWAQDKAAPGAAQTEMQKWIATTDAQWQAAFKRDVAEVHAAELSKAKVQYLTALEEGIKKASAANDLKRALALRDEQKRFGDTQVFPEKDEEGDTDAVKAIRAAIRAQLAKVEKDHAVRAKTLHAKYDQILAQAQTQLTKAQRLDDAQLVQARRDEIAAAWMTPAVLAAAEKTGLPITQPVFTPPAVSPKSNAGTTPAQAAPKGKYDAQIAKLTRGAWTWETVTGKGAIKFEKDGTCVHSNFRGTYEFVTEETVIVHMASRPETLTFNFGKGEFTAYDPVLQQKIFGRRTNQK